MAAMVGREILPIPISEVVSNTKSISADYIRIAHILSR